jgi:hypothetical protein
MVLLALLAGCVSREPRPASVVIDTLPGGIPRVTSSAPAGWTDTNGWRFVELPPVAPPAGSPGELINPSGLAIDADGRLYVVDQSPTVIKQYDSSGAFIRAIGREGDGPGEYRFAHIAVRGHLLLVHDAGAGRTSLFDTSGAFIRSFRSVGRVFDQVDLDAAGRAVLPMMNPPGSDSAPARAYARFDSLGVLLDTIAVPRLAETPVWTLKQDGKPFLQLPMPFAPSTIYTFGSDSGLIYGASSDYALVRSAGHGDTIRVWRRAWTPPPLPDSIRTLTLDKVAEFLKRQGLDEVSIHESLDPSDLPATAPAYLSVRADEHGDTYTTVIAANGDVRMDVFDPGGVWLGSMARPPALWNLTSTTFSHGVYAGVTTGDDGIPVIRRWAIQDGQAGQDGQGEQNGR